MLYIWFLLMPEHIETISNLNSKIYIDMHLTLQIFEVLKHPIKISNISLNVTTTLY